MKITRHISLLGAATALLAAGAILSAQETEAPVSESDNVQGPSPPPHPTTSLKETTSRGLSGYWAWDEDQQDSDPTSADSQTSGRNPAFATFQQQIFRGRTAVRVTLSHRTSRA